MNHPKSKYQIECVRTGGPEQKRLVTLPKYTKSLREFLLSVLHYSDESHHTKRELQLGLAGLQNFCSKGVALERHQVSWLQKYSLLSILSFFSLVVGWAIKQDKLWVMTLATNWRVPAIQLDLKAAPTSSWLLLSCIQICCNADSIPGRLSHYCYFKEQLKNTTDQVGRRSGSTLNYPKFTPYSMVGFIKKKRQLVSFFMNQICSANSTGFQV